MPVTIKVDQIKYKNGQGQYIGANAVSERTTAEQVAAVQAAGASTISEVEQAVSDSQAAVDSLESQKNTIAQTVASMAQLGTDTTLTTPGMAADAKATGDECSALKSAFSIQEVVTNIKAGWENRNYAGASNSKRLSVSVTKAEALKYMTVIAPTGYKVGISANNSYVWTGTAWSTANLLMATEIDIWSIDISAYNTIRFCISADDDSEIATSVGDTVTFIKKTNYAINDAVNVNTEQIFNTYVPVDNLNNASENTTYIVQKTASTPTTNFPSDYPNGVLGILSTYKAYSSSTVYQIVQMLFVPSKMTYWRRLYGSNTSSWGNWSKYESALNETGMPIMNVYDKQLFDNYAQTFLSDLNNANDNTTYIVHRTALTTTTNFPSDFGTGMGVLYCYKAYFNASSYQRVQIIVKLNNNKIWSRTLNSTQSTWADWTLRSSTEGISRTVYIGTGEEYTTLKAGIAAAIASPNTIVYVKPGTYDLTQEFASDISGTMGKIGLGLGNGIHIIFHDGAKVTANFDNSESTYDATTWRRIYDYFNPFYSNAVSGNADFIIENLDIECSNTRYCVHDEMSGSGTYIHKFINCKMKYTNDHSDINYVQCIGGGLGEHGTIVIDGGYYKSVPNYGQSGTGGDASNNQQCISYHNGNISTADSSITIKNVYLADRGFMRFGYYGTSSIDSFVYINGCSTGLPTLKKREGTGSNPDNFEVVEWGNEKRNNYHWVISSDGTTATLVAD